MSEAIFQKASKSSRKLRCALAGQSGSGKTLTALKIGRYLGGPNARMCLIDSEHRTSDLYGMLPKETVERPEEGKLDFDMLDLTTFMADKYPENPFAPEKYMAALDAAEAAGYDVVIVDSLSHAWAGQGGLLDEVSDIAKATRQKRFYAWREGIEIQTRLINRILSFRNAHIICTMRTKIEYAMQSDDRGAVKSISRVGTVPVQGKGIHYEFDVLLEGEELNKNSFRCTKSRFFGLTGRVFEKPGKELAQAIRSSLEELDETHPDAGEPESMVVETAPPAVVSGRKVVESLVQGLKAKGIDAKLTVGDGVAIVTFVTTATGESSVKQVDLSSVQAGETAEQTRLRAYAKILSTTT